MLRCAPASLAPPTLQQSSLLGSLLFVYLFVSHSRSILTETHKEARRLECSAAFRGVSNSSPSQPQV